MAFEPLPSIGRPDPPPWSPVVRRGLSRSQHGCGPQAPPKAKQLESVYSMPELSEREALKMKILDPSALAQPRRRRPNDPDDGVAEFMRRERLRAEERAEQKWRRKFQEWQRAAGAPGLAAATRGGRGGYPGSGQQQPTQEVPCAQQHAVDTNDRGAPVAVGADGSGRFYCGRVLGKEAIPGSDGSCGPNDGPQCASCRRFQKARDAQEPLPPAGGDRRGSGRQAAPAGGEAAAPPGQDPSELLDGVRAECEALRAECSAAAAELAAAREDVARLQQALRQERGQAAGVERQLAEVSSESHAWQNRAEQRAEHLLRAVQERNEAMAKIDELNQMVERLQASIATAGYDEADDSGAANLPTRQPGTTAESIATAEGGGGKEDYDLDDYEEEEEEAYEDDADPEFDEEEEEEDEKKDINTTSLSNIQKEEDEPEKEETEESEKAGDDGGKAEGEEVEASSFLTSASRAAASEREAAAATRIQSVHRGKAARRRASEQKAERERQAAREADDAREAAAIRAELARQQETAATRIQSLLRGNAARREAAEKARRRDAFAAALAAEAAAAEEELALAQAAAATRIQSVHRGKASRRQVAERKAAGEAAAATAGGAEDAPKLSETGGRDSGDCEAASPSPAATPPAASTPSSLGRKASAVIVLDDSRPQSGVGAPSGTEKLFDRLFDGSLVMETTGDAGAERTAESPP